MSRAVELKAFEARLKLAAFTRKQQERFDRCCHGGVVSYRLPLLWRIEVANRSIGALSK